MLQHRSSPGHALLGGQRTSGRSTATRDGHWRWPSRVITLLCILNSQGVRSQPQVPTTRKMASPGTTQSSPLWSRLSRTTGDQNKPPPLVYSLSIVPQHPVEFVGRLWDGIPWRQGPAHVFQCSFLCSLLGAWTPC